MTTIKPVNQTINPPSLTALLDAHKRDILKTANCARVAQIISYDPGVTGQRPPTATVQIAQQQVTGIDENGNQTLATFPELQLVPVWFMGGGGFRMTWPIAEGDEGLLVFNDRELDNWFTNGPGLAPTIGRVHDLADAIIFVGLQSGPNAIAASTAGVQIVSEDYTSPSGAGELIQISSGKIQLIANEVVIHGRNKATFDAGGTGFVYTPALISTYTDGVTTSHSGPTPPEVPT